MSNWLYANEEPTAIWRGAQSIPRKLALRRFADGVRLVQAPIAEVETLRTAVNRRSSWMKRGCRRPRRSRWN